MKIQIIGRKVYLRCKGKTLLGVVNKLLKTKRLLTSLKVKVKVMGSNSGYLLKSFLLYYISNLISFFLDLEDVMNLLSQALENQNHQPNTSVFLRALSLMTSGSGRTWPVGNGKVVKPVLSTN